LEAAKRRIFGDKEEAQRQKNRAIWLKIGDKYEFVSKKFKGTQSSKHHLGFGNFR